MDASDAVVAALTGRAATTERIDSATAVRVRLSALRTDIGQTAALLPSDGGTWRSEAADRYAESLHDLRALVLAGVERLDAASAELDERIRRMQTELAAFEQAARDAEERARADREAALAEEARLVSRAAERATVGVRSVAGGRS
ncbi:hypothetical protein ACFVTX_10400 [Agromyces sp. NPDC058136]|uniref:hypothetical protein n=1 Tax=Agromyces sp. NPDC058136 TaxID=3346354 RepID=UPI0036DC4729